MGGNALNGKKEKRKEKAFCSSLCQKSRSKSSAKKLLRRCPRTSEPWARMACSCPTSPGLRIPLSLGRESLAGNSFIPGGRGGAVTPAGASGTRHPRLTHARLPCCWPAPPAEEAGQGPVRTCRVSRSWSWHSRLDWVLEHGVGYIY